MHGAKYIELTLECEYEQICGDGRQKSRKRRE
jgi:hypothetical protein